MASTAPTRRNGVSAASRSFEELLTAVAVYPFTSDAARLAGKIDAEQQAKSVVIPFGDLLIGATALSLGYSVVTVNLRHFRQVPDLSVVQF